MAPQEAHGTARAAGGAVVAPLALLPTALTALSRQATELLDAILEGYPKSKKQFFVSTEAGPCPGLLRQSLSLF